MLVVCLRTLGVTAGQITLTEAFAGWTFVRLLGSLPITPGGLGVVELGLTGALVGFGGPNDAVVAAVLLYRVITIVPTLVLGLVAGALWRRLRPRTGRRGRDLAEYPEPDGRRRESRHAPALPAPDADDLGRARALRPDPLRERALDPRDHHRGGGRRRRLAAPADPHRPLALRTVATIGVYDWTLERFLDALREADVALVVDVRQRRGVRGREYAWANAQRLEAALTEAGIAYSHHKELAPTTELRHLQYAEDDRLGVGKRTRTELAPEYVQRYTHEILDQADLEPLVAELPVDRASALLCVERDPEACHRSLVAERLAAEYGVTVVDLRPAESSRPDDGGRA